MEVFKFIQEKLNEGKNLQLLYVVESNGSSPGRQGFKMTVASDDSFCGTIGGGIMEFKLVEKAKALLQQSSTKIFLQEQFHDKEKTKNQSGMICSGSQTIAFIPISSKDRNIIEEIIQSKAKTLEISLNGILINDNTAKGFEILSDEEWKYSEPLILQNKIHIIGGGHCSLALSELMHFLGFYVCVYDDRKELNTIEQNKFADQIELINYETIDEEVQFSTSDFVVIMTVGYRTDKIVLQQLINKKLFYLGLLGSKKKIETLFIELLYEGFAQDLINKVHAPIGFHIHSKTTQEIAVSIAAEIISIKNNSVNHQKFQI